MKRGMVYLVGAGPGDPGLATVKAIECIEKAEVLVYDRLADPRLAAKAPATAERIFVGKASNRHTMPQDEINRVLAERAAAGRTVVRLKGGDPFVFGRGGEEALYLQERDIPFEIVPGITSAIAVPAYAGIPVTHRGLATSFAVITGHEDPEKEESTIQWDKLATAVDTLVFLMGVENLPFIAENLVKYGRDPATPAALISWGTRPEQRVVVTTVGSAVDDARRENVRPPAIFMVGKVVELRSRLAWFDSRPLFGQTFLVTRAREQASALTVELEALGARCIEAPSIRIADPEDWESADRAIASLPAYDWVIFTSVNGVTRFFDRLYSRGLDARSLSRAKVAAIGSETAARLRSFGIAADLVPAEFRAEGVAAALKGLMGSGAKVLIARAAVARDVLPEEIGRLVCEGEALCRGGRDLSANRGLRDRLQALHPGGRLRACSRRNGIGWRRDDCGKAL